MNYYRRGNTIGAARDTAAHAAYLAVGFAPVDAAQTVPGMAYTIGGPDNRVDPRAWDNATGLRATRRAEWCRTCGQWLQTPGGCLCARRRAPQAAPVTTRPSRTRKGLAVDIVCGPRCKRYFVAYGAVGLAMSPDAYLAYHRAGWARAGHGTVLGVVRDAVEDLTYTAGGPDKLCTREAFLRIVRGRAQVTTPDGR